MTAILGTQWNPVKAGGGEGNRCETSKDNLTDF